MVLQLSIGSRDVLETYIGGTPDSSELIEIPWGDHAFDALPGGLSGQVALFHTERFLADVFR